jgi:hypothetical protein
LKISTKPSATSEYITPANSPLITVSAKNNMRSFPFCSARRRLRV